MASIDFDEEIESPDEAYYSGARRVERIVLNNFKAIERLDLHPDARRQTLDARCERAAALPPCTQFYCTFRTARK